MPFAKDHEWQLAMRDKILIPHFYQRFFWLRFELITDTATQKRGIDTIILGSSDPVTIDEKIVRWPKNKDGTPRVEPLTAFALETHSCTNPGYESAGWMSWCEADRLLYCFSSLHEDGLRCFWMDFPRLKAWFWPKVSSFSVWRGENELRSICRIVPIDVVKENVNLRYWGLANALGGMPGMRTFEQGSKESTA